MLDAVAKAEGLEVTDEEVQAAVTQMAVAGRVDPKTFEDRLRKSGRMQTVRWQILRDKAADFIAANAVPLTEGAAAVAEAKEALAKAKQPAAKAAKPRGGRGPERLRPNSRRGGAEAPEAEAPAAE